MVSENNLNRNYTRFQQIFNCYIPSIKNEDFIELPIKNYNKIKNLILENQNIFLKWNQPENNYMGYGLTYNKYNIIRPFESQVLGKYQYDTILNSYEDSWGFYYKNDLGKRIYDLMEIPLMMIRSRIALLKGDIDINSRSSWHKDESPYECIRVNVPIITNDNFHLQLKNKIITPKEGYMYIWNTSLIHRAFCSNTNNTNRISLVLGYNPYYYLENDKWVRNLNNSDPLTLIKNIS